MGRAKEHPDRMLSDIEQRWCRDCGQYWNVKNFYLDCDGGDYGYCKECQLERNRKTKEMWRKRKNAAKAKTPPEIKKRNPKPTPRPTPTTVRTAEAVPMGTRTTEDDPTDNERCSTCKSYSRHDAWRGWCMCTRKQVRGKGWCPRYRQDVPVRYEQEAKVVAVSRCTPWD